ncbi:MAG: TRAP transporter substrate-binding protein DctP [Gammaproteobacteria bacterium]|nr:TRAP transporter substrate-binding protein DctP [Gammaproteobacteria bacterium]
MKTVSSFKKTALALTFGLATGAATTATAQETYQLTFSTYLPPAYEYFWDPVQHFVEEVEANSDGRIQIDVFHSAQLFDGFEELEAVSRGDVDFTAMTGTYPSGTIRPLSIFTLPFVFDDVDHMQRALNGGLLDLGITQEFMDDHGVKILGVAPWDPYEFYTKDQPLESVEDFAGLTWATTGSTDARAMQVLGGSPTGMGSGDLYLAFDRGVIDGTPRPLLTGIGRSLYEVIDHIALGTFSVDTSILSVNAETWDSLPADLQQVVADAAASRDQMQFELVADFIDESIGRYESLGVSVKALEPAVLDNLRAATQPVIEEWLEEVDNGSAYLDLVEETR